MLHRTGELALDLLPDRLRVLATQRDRLARRLSRPDDDDAGEIEAVDRGAIAAHDVA